MSYYPYCVHGRYVGGCGADYMCGACEMGEEPTPEEIAHYEEAKAEYAKAEETAEGRYRNIMSLPAEVLDGP